MKMGDLIEILIHSPFDGGKKGDIGQLYTVISHRSDPKLDRWVVLFGTVYHTLYDDEFKVVAST